MLSFLFPTLSQATANLISWPFQICPHVHYHHNNPSHLHLSSRTIAVAPPPADFSTVTLATSNPSHILRMHGSLAADDSFQWLPVSLRIKRKLHWPTKSRPFPCCWHWAVLTLSPLSTFLILVTWSSLSSSCTPSSFLPQSLCTTSSLSPFPFLLL